MKTYLLHSIGELSHPNYNSRGQIEAANGLLTFDGIYSSVWLNRNLLKGRETILFVIGDWVGDTNWRDPGKVPKERMCSWDNIVKIAAECGKAEIGWHSWTHRDLRKLNDEELRREVTPPFPMKSFAYPHGRFDSRVIEFVEAAGYERAYAAGKHGDGSRFQIRRKYL